MIWAALGAFIGAFLGFGGIAAYYEVNLYLRKQRLKKLVRENILRDQQLRLTSGDDTRFLV